METAGPRDGWAITLQGAEDDLLAWEDVLAPPFSPWVERYTNQSGQLIRLFRDERLLDAETAREVYDATEAAVARLNGLLAAVEGTRPVSVGSGMRFEGGRPVSHVLFPQPGVYTLRVGRVRITAGAAKPTGPSQAQRLLALSYPGGPEQSARADIIADLCDHLGRAENWYDVYKTLELAIMLCGGEDALFDLPFAKAARAAIIKQNANFHRHAPGRFRPPKKVIALEEAARGVQLIAVGVLSKIAAEQDDAHPK